MKERKKPVGKTTTKKKKPVKPSGAKKSPKKSGKNSTVKKAVKKAKKRLELAVPTNNKPNLVELGLMKPQAYLTETTPTLTRIRPLQHKSGRTYYVDNETATVSTLMKLVLKIHQTKSLSETWSLILWDINQRDLLPEGVSVTFVRSFERRDNDLMKKKIKRRGRMAVLSSDSNENVAKQTVAVQHDLGLLRAIESGDSVVGFAAEVLVSAPNEFVLEEAVASISDYMNLNDETRGLHYELDINRLSQPLVTYGPNDPAGNKDIYMDMTSYDAGLSALFVDSGGDRTPGSEYVGVSVGKLIRSHAAYNFQNTRSLYIGNDTLNKTHTIAGIFDEPSQIYLSKVVSRSYLLEGRSVTHIVADHADSVKHLMDFPLNDDRKLSVDVSKGLLNIIEPIKTPDVDKYPERIISRFPMHINNIITLLTMFRDVQNISVTDDFSSIAREVLINFFTTNKYWVYNAENNLSDIRFFSYHSQYKMLKDFGAYVAQRMKSNVNKRLENALFELDTIINKNILPTIPSLNTKTDPVIDQLMVVPYRVVDLTGMGIGAMANVDNPSMNVMMISYLNVLLPSLSNGDVVIIHGLSRMSKIAGIIQDMLASNGFNVDVVFTESNQTAAVRTKKLIETNMNQKESDDGEETEDAELDFVMVDLYENNINKLVKPFNMDMHWSNDLRQSKASFYIKTRTGMDYIYLDRIL